MLDTQTYPQTQTKHSHTGLWFAIGAMAAIAIFSLFLVATIGLGLNKVKESGPTSAQFYMALQDHNYPLAYTYLDAKAKVNNQEVDQLTFISQAAQADARNNTISGFDVTDKGDNASATVKVTRGKLSYEVHLQLKQTDGKWFITGLDRI